MRKLFFLPLLLAAACNSRQQAAPLRKTSFPGGQLQVAQKVLSQGGGGEQQVRFRFRLDRKFRDAAYAQYLQYELGGRLRLVAGKDTVAPSLFYYVPLIGEEEREIDCHFRLPDGVSRGNQVFLNDSILAPQIISVSL